MGMQICLDFFQKDTLTTLKNLLSNKSTTKYPYVNEFKVCLNQRLHPLPKNCENTLTTVKIRITMLGNLNTQLNYNIKSDKGVCSLQK